MTEYTIKQINFEIDRLQKTFDILKNTDFTIYPFNKDLCLILISTIATLKSSIQYEQRMDLIQNTYKGETLPFSILETA